MKFDSWKALNTLFFIVIIVAFVLFFKNVSIGEKIGSDCCEGDKGEQLWNLGVFIAIMYSFYGFINETTKESYLGSMEDKNEKAT